MSLSPPKSCIYYLFSFTQNRYRGFKSQCSSILRSISMNMILIVEISRISISINHYYRHIFLIINENKYFFCYNRIPSYETMIDIIPMKSNTLLYQNIFLTLSIVQGNENRFICFKR